MRRTHSPICATIGKSTFTSVSSGDLKLQLNAYISWFEQMLGDGRDGYLASVTFHSIGGSPEVRIRQMQSDLIAMYGRLAKRVVRNPSKSSKKNELPTAVFFPDSGYYSHSRRGSRDVWVNDGLHMHGYMAAMPTARCPETLDIHFEERRDLYRVGRIRQIDVRHVEYDEDYVADYALKALKRGRHSIDDVLILPRSGTEL